MITTPAPAITKAASKQTYYTIRFLVDRTRVEDAHRAYGYFRWVDDILDSDSGSASERRAFLERQKSLLDKCYQGEAPRDANLQEKMLVELVQHDRGDVRIVVAGRSRPVRDNGSGMDPATQGKPGPVPAIRAKRP